MREDKEAKLNTETTKMDFENTKVHVKNEAESKAVQEAMFKRGFSWGGGTQKVQYCNEPYIYFERTSISYGTEGDNFNTYSHKEVTVKQILGKCRGRPVKIKPDNMVRYMVYGTGCNNKSNIYKTEEEIKEKAKGFTQDSSWSGRIIGYKMTPIFEAEKSVRLKKFKI